MSLILDDGEPVKVFTIEGSGSYVDTGINTPIGSYTLGSKVIGGGGEATAHPFDVTFEIHTDIFQHISVRFEATAIGHAAIDSYTYKDVRDKGRKSLATKTVQLLLRIRDGVVDGTLLGERTETCTCRAGFSRHGGAVGTGVRFFGLHVGHLVFGLCIVWLLVVVIAEGHSNSPSGMPLAI